MKKIIYIIVIVLGLGGAIVMGYMVIRGNSHGIPSITMPTEGVSQPAANYQILPYGHDLDFKKVEEYNKNKILFPYPKVSPSEIGAAAGSMME